MLRKRVVDAVANGKFNVYATTNIDECMEILTGIEAGTRDKDGKLPETSLNGRIETQLIALANRRAQFHNKSDNENL